MKKRIIARLYIEEGSIPAFREQADLIIRKTRQEAGCLFYSLFQDVQAPGEFLFYEEYRDQEALDAHRNSEHLRDFRAGTVALRSKDPVVEVV